MISRLILASNSLHRHVDFLARSCPRLTIVSSEFAAYSYVEDQSTRLISLPLTPSFPPPSHRRITQLEASFNVDVRSARSTERQNILVPFILMLST